MPFLHVRCQAGPNCTNSRRARPRVFEDEEGTISISIQILLLHQCAPIDALRVEERTAPALGGPASSWELVAAPLLWPSSCRLCRY